jgi:3',5'-cyclic AMP phosphodiesterase CpdA
MNVTCALAAILISQNPGPVAPEILHRPTAQPDRIRLTWNGDPATTQAVTWRTDHLAGSPQIQWTIDDGSPGIERRATLLAGRTEEVASDLGWKSRYHTAVLTELKPKTEYVYRVGDGVNWSEWHHFMTAADKFEPFSFTYFGDAQNGIRPLWARVARRAFAENPNGRFFLYAGDLVNRANSDAEWGDLYNGPGWVNARIPIIPVAGNHEIAKDPRRLSDHWRPHFELPLNGPKGLEESCYRLDFQGLRILVLNSNEPPETQTQWLKDQLKDKSPLWTVVSFHHPIFSASRGRDNPLHRKEWKPVLEEGGVDLVLQGHDHTYGRSSMGSVTPAKPGGATPVYVVSVSGSKMYELNPQPWMVRAAEDTQLYQHISLTKNRLEYVAKTAAGEVYDAFTLVKDGARRSRMIDRKPKSPDRRRPKATEPAKG